MFFRNKFEQSKDPGQSWKLINDLLGKNRKSNISQLKIDDVTTISDDKLLAETFNEFFVNIWTTLASEIEYESMNVNSGNSANYYQNPSQDILFNFSEIHPDEVIHQLANLKISKSTGIDNIPSKALKIAANIIGPSLTWIFNLSIKTGIYVDEWKKARVVPIYKSGNRQKCENYRPISILPIISKILERSVFNQIYKFLNDNLVFLNTSQAFGQIEYVVLLDIRKAFDSINHTILLHKMKVQFGITNFELDWFSSYLTNREQVCLVNGITSAPKKIVCGVPQGSFQGPLLFLLYINDLPDCLDKTTPCLYEDDTQIFSAAKDLENLTENINHDMNKLCEWLIRNKLQHHPTKTKIIYIGSRHNHKIMNDDILVVINNQLVPGERSFTCVGVKLDETLEWNEHIEVICKKVAAGIGTVKRIKPFVPANTLQTIYQALIQPYFDYCSPLWGVCSKQLKDKLQRFQNRAARIIAGASFETRSADVLCSLAWDDLLTRRCRTKSILLYKVLNGCISPNLMGSLILRNTRQTNYDLRNSLTDLTLPKPKGEYLKKSFNYSGAKLWNSLPFDAKVAESVSQFKNIIRGNDS